jgi:hypothetical protein
MSIINTTFSLRVYCILFNYLLIYILLCMYFIPQFWKIYSLYCATKDWLYISADSLPFRNRPLSPPLEPTSYVAMPHISLRKDGVAQTTLVPLWHDCLNLPSLCLIWKEIFFSFSSAKESKWNFIHIKYELLRPDVRGG